MVNGPPCQQCGYPLRWFAEQNAWGCDRCRQLFPAAPQPHYQPQVRARPGKKSMMPWIVLGAGAVTGIIIAVVIATGGGGASSSPKGVAEAALVALSAGDTDKLAALADIENLYKSFVKCDENEADESPAELAAKEKSRFAKSAEKAKGLKLKLVELPDFDNLGKDHVMAMPKGTKVAKGCASTAEATIYNGKMKVSVQDGDKPAVERDVELDLIKIDGKFYLAQAPRVDKSSDSSAQIAKMTELRDRMCACADLGCASKVSDDMAAWAQANSAQMNETMPSDDDMKKLMAISEELTKCMQKATATVATAPPADPPALPLAEMPKPCQEWKAGIDKLDHCAQIPKQTTTALRSSYDRSAAAWAKLSGETRQSAMSSCDSARDAVNNLLKATGCL